MIKFDFRGLKCPIPVLKAHKIIKNATNQTLFEFICDDKSAPKDFADLCNNAKYKLSDISKKEDAFIIRIEKIISEK